MNYNDLKPQLEQAMKAASICEDWRSLLTKALEMEKEDPLVEFFMLIKRRYERQIQAFEYEAEDLRDIKETLEDEISALNRKLDKLEDKHLPNPNFLDPSTYHGEERIAMAMKIAENYDLFQLQELCKTLKVA